MSADEPSSTPLDAPAAILGDRAIVPVAPDLIAGTASEPVLLGSECRRCGIVTFPRQATCPRCTSADVGERRLARRGTLWTWTVQRFRPKSPPYSDGDGDEFEPYAVGYVELPGELRVEARLTESDPARLTIGMEMELTLIPVPGRDDAVTFAFRPAEQA
jgi:uncharacterized OB-fold protein